MDIVNYSPCSVFDFPDLLCLGSLYVLQGDGDQERLKRQQELTALNLYQLQQLQYQYLLRYDTFMKEYHTAPSRDLSSHNLYKKYTAVLYKTCYLCCITLIILVYYYIRSPVHLQLRHICANVSV